MSESFQILRGSSMRLSQPPGLLVGADLEPVLDQDDAGVDHRLLDGRAPARGTGSPALGRAEAHHPLDAGAVVPAAVEDDHLAGRREVRHVALDVHLGLLPLGRRGQRHDPEHPGAHPLDDPLDRAALAGGVPALEHDADLRRRWPSPTPAWPPARPAASPAPPRTPCAAASPRGRPPPVRSRPRPARPCAGSCSSWTRPRLPPGRMPRRGEYSGWWTGRPRTRGVVSPGVRRRPGTTRGPAEHQRLPDRCGRTDREQTGRPNDDEARHSRCASAASASRASVWDRTPQPGAGIHREAGHSHAAPTASTAAVSARHPAAWRTTRTG